MFSKKYILLIILIIAFINKSISQTKKDSLLLKSDALFIDRSIIDSLGITTIEFIEYLSAKEKKSPEINAAIFSKQFEFKFNKGYLQTQTWLYSGLDSLGIDHFELKTVGFKPYSFIFEDSYSYNENGELINIIQNTPHEKSNAFHIYKRIKLNEVLINKTPANGFILDNFSDVSQIIIELYNNGFLQFELD